MYKAIRNSHKENKINQALNLKDKYRRLTLMDTELPTKPKLRAGKIEQTPEIEDYICQRLSEGSSLITIGNELGFSPSLIYKAL